MKKTLCSFLVLLSVVSGYSRSSAQSFAVLSHRVDSLMQAEASTYTRGQFLLAHSESFKRLLWLRALNKIGLTTDQFLAAQVAGRIPSNALSSDSVFVGRNDLSNDILDQDEPSLAISRANPNLIVVGANDGGMYDRSMPAYVTTDAGMRWQTYRMPRYTNAPYQPGGDPMLCSDADGRIYYAFLIYDYPRTVSNLQIASSIDGEGWTYTPPVLADGASGGLEDKEAIAVDRDRNSPHFGRLYLAWVHYSYSLAHDTTGMKFCFSDDHGATWSVPKFLTQRESLFHQPIVGHNGLLAITYSDYRDSTSSGGSHYVLLSKDGGDTFIRQTIATYRDYPKKSTGGDGLKGTFGFRAFPYIASVIDQLTNRIEVVYGDYNISLKVAKLYTTASIDLGTSWSTPVSLTNLDATGDVFHPALALDQTSGRLFVSYYSSVSDVNNLFSKINRTEITAHGLGATIEIESVAFDPTHCGAQSQGPFIGDYTGSDAYSGVYASAWTEGSNQGDGEIFSYVSSPLSGVESKFVARANVTLSHPSSDPVFDEPVSIAFTTSHVGAVRLELLNFEGKIVKRDAYDKLEAGEHSASFDFSGMAAGPYFFRLNAEGEVHSEPIVHVR